MEALAVRLTGTNASSIQALALSDFKLPTTSEAERRSALLWWAYGLFSQDARHSIQRVAIPLFYGENDLSWLAELLRTQGAPRPELFIADAFDEYVDREAPTHDHWLVVPSGYRIRVKRGYGAQDTTVVFTETMRFRVLCDEPKEPYVDILVPDYGRCWAERSDALVTEATPITTWTLDQHAIRAMVFEFCQVDDSEVRWLCEFVELFGARNEELRLWCEEPAWDVVLGTIYPDEMASLVRSCPKLEMLELNYIQALDLVQLYELESCRIKKIVLSGHHHNNHHGVGLLFLCLADEDDPVAQRLEELSLDLSHYSLDEHDVMYNLFKMLQNNRVLKKVHLHVPTSDLAKYAYKFQELRDTEVLVGAVPLPSRHKCALLSAVDQKTERPVESGVLESVFAFAAEPEPRVITITETTRKEQVTWHTR